MQQKFHFHNIMEIIWKHSWNVNAWFVFVGICFECHSMGQSVISTLTHYQTEAGGTHVPTDAFIIKGRQAQRAGCLSLLVMGLIAQYTSSVLWQHPDVIDPWESMHAIIHNNLNIKGINAAHYNVIIEQCMIWMCSSCSKHWVHVFAANGVVVV